VLSILAQFNNIDKTQGNIRPENDFIVIEKITKKVGE
tara:strand:- start:1729 stop:1839 length:111 start_codon:yes stop_codon:yes gene_type:complete